MIFLVSLCCFIASCGSDELTNSKAKRIIQECLKQNPKNRTITINKEYTVLKGQLLEKYRTLKDKGLIDFTSLKSKIPKPNVKILKTDDPIEKWAKQQQLKRYEARYKDAFEIVLKDKSLKYISNAEENSEKVKIKIFEYVVDEILEVREIPSINEAKVKVRYKPDNFTPFAPLSRKDSLEFLIKDVTMTKTSNGWKFCDNY